MEQTRRHDVFSSPIGDYLREFPGNRISDLVDLSYVLEGIPWLAETGTEASSHLHKITHAVAVGDRVAEPEWRVRTKDSVGFVRGRVFIDESLGNWRTVYRVEEKIKLEQALEAVALAENTDRDLVLLRLAAEGDTKSDVVPVRYYLGPTSLIDHPDLAEAIGDPLGRLEGLLKTAEELRQARTASTAEPGRYWRPRGRKPRQWVTRELERQICGFGVLLRRKYMVETKVTVRREFFQRSL
jgi:hypothetical protein